MNPVRRAVETGEYQQGIAEFDRLAETKATDYRWLGICLHHQGRYPEAELRLGQAAQGGDSAAHIFLAALCISQGRTPDALNTLKRVSPQTLADEDAALWYRERARIGWMLGERRDQLLEWAKDAWLLCAQGTLAVQVSVATFLGSLHQHFGEHEQALAYLQFAEANGHARRLEYVFFSQAEALVALRRLEEAQQVIERIQILRPFRDLIQAQLLCRQERWSDAWRMLLALLPEVTDKGAEEFMVRMALLQLATRAGDVREARRQWRRAEHLARAPLRRAELCHRAGLFLVSQNEPGGLDLLEQAVSAYQAAEHVPGTVISLLALAEGDPAQREVHVTTAADAAATLNTLPDLTPEWPFLPQVRAYLDTLPAKAYERLLVGTQEDVHELTLLTLGDAALQTGDRRVTFRYARSVEILSYLCRREQASLSDIQHDLFPDVPPARAKNYFHQVRVDITSRVPGLDIGFDTRKKTYSIKGRHVLRWDAHELTQALAAHPLTWLTTQYSEFLPGADSEWARGERDRLRRWMTQIGLETMESWFQTGEYDKCIQLAERLLPIDPLDEGLHTFLLTATYHARGRLSALHRYHASAASFLQEVGEIPDSLQQLELSWRAFN